MEKAEREMRKKQHQKNPSIESRSQVHGITTIVTLPWRHQIFAIIVVMFLIFMSVSTISIPGFSRAFDDTEDGGNDTGGNVWDRIGYQDDDTIEKITDPGAENEEHSNTGNPEDNWDTGYVNCKSKRNGEENENENGLTVDEWTIQDPDHDDLFDFLSVNITFSKPASANMRIIWNLESSNPEAAGQNVMGITDLSKDQENISLILPGADIYIREINGPFHLSLELIEEDSTINSTSVILNEELSYRAFESPFPCGFLANIEHKGIDTDGDQLYDHLEINTTVFTRDVGNYTIMGELVDQATYRSRKDPSGDKPSSKGEPGYSGIYFGNDAIASSFHSLLINDTRELNSKAMLRFDGTLINLSNIDGPYYVLAYIFHEGGYVDYRDWMITGYEHQLFQGPSIYATLTGTYFINSQTKGFHFNAGVHVDVPDSFQLTGEVFSYFDHVNKDQSKDQYTDTITTYLEAGYHNMTLDFESSIIIQNTHILLTLTSLSTSGSDMVELEYKYPAAGEGSNDYAPSADYEDIGDSMKIDPTIITIGIDDTGDEKYEYLKINVNTDLSDGDYKGYAVVYADAGDEQERVISSVSGDFIVKDNGQEHPFLIPGNDIYLSGLDGPYDVQVFITSKDGKVTSYKGTTMIYKSDDFSPYRSYGTDPEPAFLIRNNSVFAHTDILATEIMKNNPELSYYYYTDLGESVKFRLRHTRLIAFNDDGDGFYSGYDSGDKTLYQAFLSTGNWDMSQITYGHDERLGSLISFNITTSLSMEPVQDGYVGVRDWGTMTLKYLIANNTVDDPELKIRGGEEIKITVEISQKKSLPATSIVLEQMIVPMNTELRGKTGEKTSWLVQDTTATIADLDTTLIEFTTEDGTVLGYYSWTNDAVYMSDEGSETQETVSPSMRISDGYVLLYFTYPITQDVRVIIHDPWAGVIRENAPPPLAEKNDEDLASPAGYLLGLILATTVVTITLYGKGRSGKEKWLKASEKIQSADIRSEKENSIPRKESEDPTMEAKEKL